MTMSIRRIAIAAAGLALTAGVIAPSAASASSSAPTGTRSLAEVLLADGNQFDSNSADFDIVTEAVLAVLAAKPASPVKVLTDGSVPLTAFIPDDKAFRILAISLTGSGGTEQEVFGKVAGLGIDTVEQVLLYHVVPGATITSRAAARADGAAETLRRLYLGNVLVARGRAHPRREHRSGPLAHRRPGDDRRES